MKYVIFKSGSLLKPVVFPDVIAHSEIKLDDKKAVPVSAGFVSVSSCGFVEVSERGSESLKMNPNPKDKTYLEFVIGGITDTSMYIDWNGDYIAPKQNSALELRPMGSGKFAVYNGDLSIRIKDIHMGTGDFLIKTLLLSKRDAETFKRILTLCKYDSCNPIDWKIIYKIKTKFNLDFSY